MEEVSIYTLVINGKPSGPFSKEELLQLDVKPSSFLRKPGMDDYKEAHEFEELRAFLGFEREYTAPQYFAGFDLRLLASCIDWLLTLFVIVLIDLIIILVLDDRTKMLVILFTTAVMLPIIKLIYHIVLENTKQATFGKQLINIKVINLQGLKPSSKQIFIRNISKIISTA